MRHVFRATTVLSAFMQREDAERVFVQRVSELLQDGLYGPDGMPIRHRPAMQPRSLEAVDAALRRVQAGEMVTPETLVGLYPRPPAEIERLEIEADTDWMNIFRTVPSNGASESYTDAKAAITFDQITAPGQEPRPSTFAGQFVELPNLEYQAAFNFMQSWIDDNKIYAFDQVVLDVKEAAADIRASYFYGLVAAAGFTSTGYATSWIASINAAIGRLMSAGRLGKSQTPIVVFPVEQLANILTAVRDSMVTSQKGERLLVIPDLIYTRYLAHADKKVYVLVPKRHFVDQERTAVQMVGPDRVPGAWYQKAGWRMRFAGMVKRTDAGEIITYS